MPIRSRRSAASRFVPMLALSMLTLPLLAGCGADDWFGENEAPPLPGERISVLAHDRVLKPGIDNPRDVIRLPAPEPVDAWPQGGGYSHHAMQHTAIAAVPREAWRSSIGEGTDKRNQLMSQPVVADGRVYAVNSRAEVTALDAESGDRLWQTDLAPEYEEDDAILGGGVAFAGGRLFVTTGFAEVVALDAATGAEVWRQKVPAPMRAAPTLYGGRVFVTTIDNKAIALAADDGRILWTHAGVEETAAMLVAAESAADNGVVVVPFTTGELAALRVDTGAQLWSDSILAVRRTDATANLADIGARPVIDGNRVFVVGHSGLLVGIDSRTGNRAWEVELAGLSQPWVAGDFLYALSTEGELTAIDARNGRILWVTQLPLWEDPEDHSGRIIWSGPTLASDRLIITGSQGQALSVDPYDGTVLGRVEMPSGVTLAPAVAGDTLYFLTDAGDIVAYR